MLSVAFYNETWQKNYINVHSSKTHAEYISLKVMVPTKIYIVVNQESVKLSEENDYQYSDVQILLAKEIGGSIKAIGNILSLTACLFLSQLVEIKARSSKESLRTSTIGR